MSEILFTVSRPVYIGNDGKQSLHSSNDNDRIVDQALKQFNSKIFNNGVPFYIKIVESDFLVESLILSGYAIWISLRYYVDGDYYGDKADSLPEKALRKGQFFLGCDDLMGVKFTKLYFIGDNGYKRTLFKI